MIEQGRQLDWRFDPLEALRRYPADRRVMLLHSGRFHRRWARWSVLAEPVGTYRFTADAARTTASGRSAWLGPEQLDLSGRFTHRPFRDLRLIQRSFEGLWIGYLGYDLARWIERLPCRVPADANDPVIELAYCPGYLVYDGADQTWHACGRWRRGGFGELALGDSVDATFHATPARSHVSRSEYEAAVNAAKAYITAGDIFQVNLAHRLTAELTGIYPLAHRALFNQLATVSPAWYGAYLELVPVNHNRHTIASTSPELFLEIDRRRHVVTRPVKGTRPASADPAELRDSAKDTAELNMIVDLLRNDLGRVCVYGSVRVVQPRTIESHPTVHHGVATIGGDLHESKDLADLLRATMPGGSITGVPKVRAMQIIDELEPVPRGPYCGAIGYLSNNQACFNIAIRTMLLETDVTTGSGRVDFSVGGGIVADSDPAAEYQETLDKAAAMLVALQLRTSPIGCQG